MKKIAWIGAHGSGKTTTCNRLDRVLTDLGISHGLVIEKARLCPLPLESFQGQMWLTNEQIKDEESFETKLDFMEDAWLICDRSIWDSLVYATHLFRNKRISADELAIVDSMATRWATQHPYDFIYLCEPKELYEDPKRPTDKDYQTTIYKLFKEIIKERGLKVITIQ